MTTSDSNQDVIMDMGALLDDADNLKPLKKGEIARGIVMRVDSNGMYLSFGQKSEGLVPIDEMKSVRMSAGIEDEGEEEDEGEMGEMETATTRQNDETSSGADTCPG